MYQLQYQPRVIREDIPQLSTDVQRRVRITIEKKLQVQPELFGAPLRQSLTGYRKLRVGDYRIVYTIQARTVTIWMIGHRSVIYKLAKGRLGR